jgi:hypothetical protein
MHKFAVSRDVEEHVSKAKFISAQNASQYMDQVCMGALPLAGFVRDILQNILPYQNGTRIRSQSGDKFTGT